MSTREEEFRNRLLATFRIEADEHLHAMSKGLLALEQEPSQPTADLEKVFREAHSLKGAARAVNLTDVESVCQELESVLSLWKKGEIAPTPLMFDTLSDTISVLTRLLKPEAASASPATDESDVIKRLLRLQSGETDFAEDVSQSELAVVPTVPVVVSVPQPVSVTSEAMPAAISKDESAPQAAPSSVRGVEREVVAETIRIATTKLDSLLLQAEELLAAKLTMRQRMIDLGQLRELLHEYGNKSVRLADEIRVARRTGSTPEVEGVVGRDRLGELLNSNRDYCREMENRLSVLSKLLEQDRRSLGGMVDGLLDDMKKVLMLPFSSMLDMVPKLVRDLARDLGKEATVTIRGGEIEIDRRILEEMKVPLIHLLRNSIDHGIELPGDRVSAGKPSAGTINVTATARDSSHVEIIVSDDGRGIDIQRVRAAAVRMGRITESQNAEMSDEEATMLIFQSEISTNSMITDLSGRGLGMAIVREKVENMGGNISLSTHEGIGSTFRIVLPLTLATFRGILVEVCGAQFIIPTANVERVLRVRREEVKTVGNRPSIIIDGQPLALIELAQVLEMTSTPPEGGWLSVLILGTSDKRVGFQVDVILDEQVVLVKSLGKQLRRVRNIAGATVLGSGLVVPILNSTDLLKSVLNLSNIKSSLQPVDAEANGHAPGPRRILVAEDSITSRILLTNILESAGFVVQTAVDGAEAFAALKGQEFDLLVSDVEMPRLDGFQLTEKVRADKRLSELPVVLVTSLSSREHQERGMDAGANAYILKSSFEQTNLLDTVQRLIA